MMSNKQDQLRAGIREAVVVSVTGMLNATASAVHNSNRKSPAKKLTNQLNNESSLVFADPSNPAVIRAWASRVLARALPEAMKLTEEQCYTIGEYAKRIGDLTTATLSEQSDLLSRVGSLVIRNNQARLKHISSELALRLSKQRLSEPVSDHVFTSLQSSRSQTDDASTVRDKIKRNRLTNTSTKHGF
jgi:hypothetical protein